MALVPSAVPLAGAVVSAPSRSQLSDSIAQLIAPNDPVVVHLAASGNDLALAQASANAVRTGGVALAARGTDSASVLAQLGALDVTGVELTGPATGFPAALVSALEASYTVTDRFVAPNPYQWSIAATDPAARDRLVVVSQTVPSSVELGTLWATSSSASLLIVDDTAPSAEVATILEDPTNTGTDIFGLSSLIAPAPTSDASVPRVREVELDNPAALLDDMALDMISGGANSRQVVAASDADAGTAGLAGQLARYSGSVASTTAAAQRYASLLPGSLTHAVVVGGASATPGASSAIVGAQRTPTADPSFRVTGSTATATNFTISFSAYSGATRYAALDAAGAQLATSTTPTLTVPGEARAVAVVAYVGTVARATLQVKMNEVTTDAPAGSSLVGSTSGSTNHLRFIGATNVPRLIERTRISVTGEAPDPLNDTSRVTVTCAPTFTDTAQDPTYQYDYRVLTLSQDPAACGAIGTPGDAAIRQISGLTFPATVYPEFRSAGPEAVTLAASMSLFDQQVFGESATSDAARSSVAPQAVGDDWPAITFRYQTFIPAKKIYAPSPVGWTVTRPWVFYNGNNRWHDPKGAFKTRQDVRVTFGSRRGISYSEDVGETIRWACQLPTAINCIETGRTEAPDSELSMPSSLANATSGGFTLKNDGTNPLFPSAPAITASLKFKYALGGTSIVGSHDRMPIHEIWFLVDGWNEWNFAYGSTTYEPACLAGRLPTCTVNVNVRL
ncbi:hypothetical protein [Cellulomonas endometrii]|uniref:hypothetical protein n=1 Tax=Cellulomonas endometrii TaxID=3036301 RepID=UPI0024AD56B9|nr:hypothetical protein [Cellulomonas endometrii]